MSSKSIVWFRKDLRLEDNPALSEAANFNKIIPIFIFDFKIDEYSKIGGASLWWLEKSLTELNEVLHGKLNIFVGDSLEILNRISQNYSVKNVFWNRCYEPDRIENDTLIKANLKKSNINVESFNSSLLWEPWKIRNKQGGAYKVFTPFFNACIANADNPRKVIKEVKNLKSLLHDKIESNNILTYKFKYLSVKKHWSNKFNNYWKPGERGAKKQSDKFFKDVGKFYAEGRNYPSKENVSKLSPFIHWGEISPFYIWEQANKFLSNENKKIFLSELGWREFSYYLLYHFPNINKENLKKNYDNFEWLDSKEDLKKWELGKTGYPIIDAGMNELWSTGYMHNRVRMIVSSFLVKNLLCHWKHGESWFRDCLLDADMASNSASWQWVAGTGTDAAPFFRIFNPITQSEKFDNQASYIKKYLPVLAKVPAKYIFQPWTADKNTLESFKVKLGENYPLPIVDYPYSRKRALDAFKKLTNKSF